ncbi:MAG: glycosyltransferase family 4 protein [Candidatus Eremiobacteraeota bacterium]|nr:glycosyltransferase family 4 protein [Candidatus Eremiobacteraeota bacterium]
MHQAAFLLPDIEPYCSVFGGAVARWTGGIMARSSQQLPHLEVLGRAGPEARHRYPGKLVRNRMGELLALYKKRPPLAWLENRYDGLLYILSWYPWLRKRPVLILENRAHYALYLRRLGYKGKLLLHLHNHVLPAYSDAYLNKLADSLDAVLSCNEFLVTDLQTRQPDLYRKSWTIHNAADESLFFPRPHLKESDSVLFVGRLVPEKGVKELLEAVSLIHREKPGVQLRIAGTAGFGPSSSRTDYERQLHSFVEQNGLADKVQFLGHVNHDQELPLLLARSTLLCLPSTGPEAAPLTIIEAMHSGTLTVASNRGGTPLLLAGTGLTVEPDPQNLAQAILTGLSDASLRVRLEQAARSLAQTRYSWPAVIDRLARLLELV